MHAEETAGLVSTVIPVYNRGLMLRRAVESVLAQTWRPIEIIIVDDGSSDDTPQVEEQLRMCWPDTVRVLSQENAGPGVARQKGLDAARGEFVQFLDSDDLLLPNKFTDQIAGLRGDPAADISYGKTYTCQRGVRESTPAQSTGERHRQLFPALLAGPIWPTLTPLYRREFLVKAGPWPAARQLEDWRYDAQAAVLGVKLNYVDTYIAEVNNHDEGRLCYLWQTDRRAMVERIEAYEIVFDLAQKAGVRLDSPEMQRYVRSLFWMARNAGAYGLPERARRLLDLARVNSVGRKPELDLFGFAVSVLGWRLVVRLTEMLRPAGREQLGQRSSDV